MVSENDRKTVTALAGAQTEFEFDFYIQDENELAVYYVDTDGNDYLLTKGVDYTVQDIDEDDFADGGQITVIVPSAGYSTGKIVILGDTDRNQETDYINNQAVEKEVYESSLDKLTMMVQELGEQVSRALLFPLAELGSEEEIPLSSARANNTLAFDEDGKPIAASVTNAIVSAFAQTVVNKADASAMLSQLGITPFIQTLLDDADAEDARNTIDVPGLADDNTFTGDNTFLGELNIYNPGGFFKSNSEQPAFKKTGNYEVQTSQLIRVVVNDTIVEIAEDTAVVMGSTPSVGTDMAIWIKTDGTLEASENFTSLTGGVRTLGGFHYAPNGNATLDPNGNWANHTGGPDPAVPQINEYSIWDVKWRPSVDDPRGLALVPILNEWWGIYPMNNGNVAGKPLHSYGVDPCRDGNAPYKRWADNPIRYNDAIPMNIFELLASEGFRPPQPWNFQFAALGTTEEASAGGSDPGNTGEQDTTQDKNRFISAWGLFDITGVIRAWSSDSWMDTTDTTGVTQGRSDESFRIQRFALLGGGWNGGSESGSRCVTTRTSSDSLTVFGGRGVCSHVVIP